MRKAMTVDSNVLAFYSAVLYSKAVLHLKHPAVALTKTVFGFPIIRKVLKPLNFFFFFFFFFLI